MSAGDQRIEPPFGLDMDFGEALERFLGTRPNEVEESVERAEQKKPPLRQARPERAKQTARLYVANRAGPVPTADIYEHLTGLGVPIRGENPVNNLSAMLSNSGIFKANGRAGSTLRQADDAEAPEEEEEEVDQDDAEQRAPKQAERSAEIRQEDLDDERPPPSSPRPPPPPPAERRASPARGNYGIDDNVPF